LNVTFLIEIVRLGLTNIARHTLRSVLTALGIILGVAAVIAMIAIGEGAKLSALSQLERLGARNIIIRSQKPPESAEQGGGGGGGGRGRMSFISRFGLTRNDVRVLEATFPDVEAIVPLKEIGGQVIRAERRRVSQSFGTTPMLAKLANLSVDRGRYLTQGDMDERASVCVIGHELAKTLFPYDDPLGETVRIDAKPMKVVGILSPIGLSGGAGAALVGRDLNFDLHIPMTTATEQFGDVVFRRQTGSMQASNVQVSEVYLGASSSEEVMSLAKLVERTLEVTHPGMTDVQMVVPYELLEAARRSALQWGIILAAIASISLFIGGIGIMNIMLATVTERTREIGIRRALGATRRHIVWQFLVETGVLSIAGGIVGIGLGVTGSIILGRQVEQMPTSVAGWSIIAAFVVSALVGLVFGLYPAIKAAAQDPIVALRHE
jgi:putative ABC transport system permease protein